jgi:FlaA1/EpsC-like NDP-sugar epimerase
MFLPTTNIPRWAIFLIDIFIVLSAVILAYLLRFNFDIPYSDRITLPYVLVYFFIIKSLSFIIARTYAGIIRYTSTEDAIRIVMVNLLCSIFFGLTNIVTYFFITHKYLIPFSIIIIEFFVSIFAMTTFRMLVKMAYLELINPSKEKSNVIIFGAGESGVITKRALDRDAGSKHKVIAFIDDDNKKHGAKLEGVTIYSTDKLADLIKAHAVTQVILAVQKLSPQRKKEIIEMCLPFDLRLFNVPPVVKWINGELSFNQIKGINIEDLLERDVIKLDERKLSKEIAGKTILITGAAGSIGSELVRQLAGYMPLKLILLDQAETALYELELECTEASHTTSFEVIIADICNEMRMEAIIRNTKPDIIYHAAAYKHVPMMENNPIEALRTNVTGTRIVADLAVKYGVKKFIMISTDKAVNPSSVMGASKRLSEIYAQALNQRNSTKFITTRFGNVLGSNGSVIPLFRRQIEKGGPITITHPDISRFFMTIPEACQLVLEAGTMGSGGEIYVFDMGKSVKIVDLAMKMIKLSGLTLGKDIQIVYSRLRPGEKLFEELLSDKENILPTHHPQIMIARERPYEPDITVGKIDHLIALLDTQDNDAIVREMKEILPEYKSVNSVFERLDEE